MSTSTAAWDELFGFRRLEGKGQIAVAIEGSGSSVLAITHTLNGVGRLSPPNRAP